MRGTLMTFKSMRVPLMDFPPGRSAEGPEQR